MGQVSHKYYIVFTRYPEIRNCRVDRPRAELMNRTRPRTRRPRGVSHALDRGVKVRVLTTDYLTVTDADALARPLDWPRYARKPSLPGRSTIRRRVST